MKILILGTRYAPIPNVEGGAIETLITEYLKYNSVNAKDDIVVYSSYSNKVTPEILEKFNKTEFRFIKTKNFKFKAKAIIIGFLRRLINNPMISNYYIKVVVKDLRMRNELEKYDVIIIENEVTSIPYVKSKLNGKIISHIHNDYFNANTPNIKTIANSCDEVWCVSKYITNRVKKVVENEDKVKLLYNGIHLERFNKNVEKPEIDNLTKKYKLLPSDFVFLYTGRIFNEKGVLELIKSFNIVSKKYDNVKLVIVGDKVNNRKSTRYYKKVMKEAKDNQNIIFTGFIDYSEIQNLYLIANVQVIPTLCEEAFGLVAVEGMACGLPIIATNSGGLPEIVEKKSGIVVERKNMIVNLSNSMQYFLNNKNVIPEISKYNQNKAKEFSVDIYCDRLYYLLNENK